MIGIQVNNGTANTTNHTTGSFDSVTSICIGAYGNACNALTFDGRIAKTGFWRKVLTAAEKTALYNSGKGLKYSALDSGLKANLQAYWNLDEASGTRNDSHSTNHLTDNNTVTQAAGPGSSVSAWADQSGHGASAAQATATKRPQWIADGGSAFNNKPVFRFNNSDLTVPSLSVSGFSVFTVANVTTNGILYEQGTGAGAPGFALYTPFASGPNIWAVFGGNTSAYDPNTNWALGAGTKIISHLYNGTHATHTIALNSAAQAFTTNVGNNPGNITSALEFNIGSRDESSLFVGADIAEMIVYNRSLSTTERNAVECYLSVKYNVTLSGVTCP